MLLFMIHFMGVSQIFDKQVAGVTVVVRGWNPDGSQPTWMQEMANAIIARSSGTGSIGTITFTGTTGNLTAVCTNWKFDCTKISYRLITWM